MTKSRISGFYNLSIEQRRAKLVESETLPQTTCQLIAIMVDYPLRRRPHDRKRNCTHALPLGIALNFQVNSQDVLIPMAIEEPSVVAGASFMAKLVRTGGGFKATTDEPLMIGQIAGYKCGQSRRSQS